MTDFVEDGVAADFLFEIPYCGFFPAVSANEPLVSRWNQLAIKCDVNASQMEAILSGRPSRASALDSHPCYNRKQ